MAEDNTTGNLTVPQQGEPELKRKRGPLTVDEFRSVLQATKDMALSWTADMPPNLTGYKKGSDDSEMNPELLRLMRQFPNFPLELSSVIFYILTGRTLFYAGPPELRQQKAEVVREFEIITDKYRSEFFFKHATKVPYFADLDWEVVIKEYERGVSGSPAVAYALLSLKIENPRGAAETRTRSITIAVNQRLVEELIRELTAVSNALQRSSTLATSIDEAKAKLEGEA